MYHQHKQQKVTLLRQCKQQKVSFSILTANCTLTHIHTNTDCNLQTAPFSPFLPHYTPLPLTVQQQFQTNCNLQTAPFLPQLYPIHTINILLPIHYYPYTHTTTVYYPYPSSLFPLQTANIHSRTFNSNSIYPLNNLGFGHIPTALPSTLLATSTLPCLTSNCAYISHTFANVNLL